MSDIKIKEPFKIEIQILEFDEKQCSLKILLSYCVFLFDEKLIEVNNRLWIECKVWDDFVSQLYKMKIEESQTAKFYTMSDNLIFELFKEDENISFTVYYSKFVNLNIKIDSQIKSSISTEQLSFLYEQLNSFEKWW